MKTKIHVLDSTLRDGMQAEKISFSVADKIKIVNALDELGIDYIEAGNPGSNIKDFEFFKEINNQKLRHAKLVAFGSTCKVKASPQEDEALKMLLSANTKTVVIFGKAWDLHVFDVLKTSLEENLRIISETISFLRSKDREIFFDAEHFFDGYQSNPQYAMSVLKAAEAAGASCVVLCDTNGGSFPDDVKEITAAVAREIDVTIGIHCHNDTGLAVANSIAAIKAGATHVQGTINGIGERCGNANLSTIIANLQLKDHYLLVPEDNLEALTPVCRSVAEVSNISLSNMPYVSTSAFSHKAGMHIDAVIKNPATFEHVQPESIGNSRDFLISEMSGKSAIIRMLQQIDPTIEKDSQETKRVLSYLKDLEYQGYQFEGALASLELAIGKFLGLYESPFKISRLQIISDHEGKSKDDSCSALIKIMVDDQTEITAVDSNGPVHAMDMAIRKALYVFFPDLEKTKLTDYKVRVLDSQAATGAKVRVLIETSDDKTSWTTIGVSTDVIEASKIALIDALEYKLLSKKGNEKP